MFNGFKIVFIGLIICLVFSGLTTHANLAMSPYNADKSNKFEKDWFIFSTKAGDTFGDALLLDNSDLVDIEAKISAKDATITKEGSFTILNEADQNKEAGNWLKLDINQVLIPKKSAVKIPFKVEIPKETKDGEYAAGFAVTTQAQTENAVKVAVRKGVRAYMAVGQDFRLSSKIDALNIVDPSDQTFDQIKKDKTYFGKDNLLLEFQAQNTGNIFGVLDCKYGLNFSDGTIFEDVFSTAISPRKDAQKYYIITNQAYKTGQTKAILDCKTQAQNIDSKKVKFTDQKAVLSDTLDLNQAALNSFESSQNPAFIKANTADTQKNSYKIESQNNVIDKKYLIGGGLILSMIIGGGVVFYFRKKQQQKSNIKPKSKI